MKVKSLLNDLMCLKFIDRIPATIYNTFRVLFKIKENVIFLESSHGSDFFGSPYYVCQEMLSDSRYNKYKIVIVSNKKPINITIKNKAKFVTIKRKSFSYLYFLAIAKYLINDTTFPFYFSRRKEQLYLNTWHGTPLKSLGRSIGDGMFVGMANTQRNFLHSTHILCPNSHTEQVILEEYMIKPVWQGVILRCGYPRNDAFFDSCNRAEGKENINIAFMPTWRGSLSQFKTDKKRQLADLLDFFWFLEKTLPQKVKIWVSLHPLFSQEIKLTHFLKISLFPTDVERYAFLGQCDALITDYSSCLFDFAVTRRPIFLYLPDCSAYEMTRGFSLPIDEIPFDRIYNQADLVKKISEFPVSSVVSTQYEKFIERFCYLDSGNSSRKICESFILNEQSAELVQNIPLLEKKKLLIFAGPFFKNGITTSLKNLVESIDSNRYIIYLWIDETVGEERCKDFIRSMNKDIFYMSTKDMFTFSLQDSIYFFLWYVLKKDFLTRNNKIKKIWKKEYVRRFAGVEWDVLIHFSGYERIPVFLMFSSEARKVVYIHNDMYSEVSSKNIDRRVLDLSYDDADVIAVVRPDAHERYCDNFLDFSKKVYYVPNCLSVRCRELARSAVASSLEESIRGSLEAVIQSALDEEGRFRFVNIGRFSPEKGQIRLIEAFEHVWMGRPESQLFIIGGYGPIYENVLERSRRSRAANSIYVIVGSENPFPIFAKMNAFILSSFYEGLALVLYESFALGVPVVSTNIPGPAELLNDGYGLVVDSSIDGIKKGMTLALDGHVPQKVFDFEGHNNYALEQFYFLVDGKDNE